MRLRNLLIAPALLLAMHTALAQNSGGWKDESNSECVLIQSRVRAGSSLREFRAVGSIDAPSWRVFAVIND
ncbi:MAG TPA: hypothetical protein VGH08_04365 [Chthoniobacterales bacterium]